MSRARGVGLHIDDDGVVVSVELSRHRGCVPELVPLQVASPGVLVVPTEWGLSDIDHDLVLKEGRKLYERRRLDIEAAVRLLQIRRPTGAGRPAR